MKLLKNSLSHFFQSIKMIDLKTSLRGSVLIFDLVQLMYYKCYIVNFIDSPDWIKNKKATINSKNEDDEWVQYTATVA